MADILISTIVYFLIALAVSTLIIYIITKVFEEQEGIGTALMAALTGAVVYALAYYFLGDGIVSALLAGIVWTLALGSLYNMGWLKAIGTAAVVWIVALVVGIFLPTLGGPL